MMVNDDRSYVGGGGVGSRPRPHFYCYPWPFQFLLLTVSPVSIRSTLSNVLSPKSASCDGDLYSYAMRCCAVVVREEGEKEKGEGGKEEGTGISTFTAP